MEALDGGRKEVLEAGRGEARLDGGREKPALDGGLRLLVDGRDDPEEEGRSPDVSTESGPVLVLRGSGMMVVVAQTIDACVRDGISRVPAFEAGASSGAVIGYIHHSHHHHHGHICIPCRYSQLANRKAIVPYCRCEITLLVSGPADWAAIRWPAIS